MIIQIKNVFAAEAEGRINANGQHISWLPGFQMLTKCGQ